MRLLILAGQPLLRVTSQNTHSNQLVAGLHLRRADFSLDFESLVVIIAGCHQDVTRAPLCLFVTTRGSGT